LARTACGFTTQSAVSAIDAIGATRRPPKMTPGSRAADPGASDPCAKFSVVLRAKRARSDCGASRFATSRFVGPMTRRHFAIACGRTSSSAAIAPLVMHGTSAS
jgi:hypothetical protein